MGAKIRHIAIATQDPDKIATFFKQALGLQQVGVANSDLATGYFLTDGYINLAILKFKNDYAAYTEGAPRYEGLHHFGFKVDDIEAARKSVEEAGATFQPLGGKGHRPRCGGCRGQILSAERGEDRPLRKGLADPHHVMTFCNETAQLKG
jgi:catechol 2,3-dioxygenase-like lactoylglutathione lyase family enzyme